MEPTNFHLDKRAESVAETIADGDALLNTRQTAELLGVSTQWLEIGRSRGYGPPFVRIGARYVRYRRDTLRAWLRSRAEYKCTRDYA